VHTTGVLCRASRARKLRTAGSIWAPQEGVPPGRREHSVSRQFPTSRPAGAVLWHLLHIASSHWHCRPCSTPQKPNLEPPSTVLLLPCQPLCASAFISAVYTLMADSTVADRAGVAAAAAAHRPAAAAHLRPAAFGRRALPTVSPFRSSTASGRQPAAAALSRRELLGSSAAAAALLPPALAAQGAAGGGAAMAASASAAPTAAAAIELRDLKMEVDSHGMQRLALQPEGAPGRGGGRHHVCNGAAVLGSGLLLSKLLAGFLA
jgi:hypothetical protein